MIQIEKEIQTFESGTVGLWIYSTELKRVIFSHNQKLIVSLASAAKLAIGYAIIKFVEDGLLSHEDIIPNMEFDPKEDGSEVYPHFQGRNSLSVREAIEVMIACHDNVVAHRVVNYAGGWEKVNGQISKAFPLLHVTENPRDDENKGEIHQLGMLVSTIYEQYQANPYLWSPIINGMVRQQGAIDGIPKPQITHMTGGLPTVIVDVGIMGEFTNYPYLYVLAGMDLPNRMEHQDADVKMLEILRLIHSSAIGGLKVEN